MTLHKHTAKSGLPGTTLCLEPGIEPTQSSPFYDQSSSYSEEDSDYDNCDAWNDDFATQEDQLVWDHLRLSPRSQDAQFRKDMDDYEVQSDEDCLSDTRASLSMSTDSCSSEEELSDLPHWWGNEDKDHARELIEKYSEVCGVAAVARKALRAARPFVGKIVRLQVRSKTSKLISLDSVYVYLYDMVPFGRTMPRTQHFWMLTHWDVNSGLPIRQNLLPQSSIDRTWMVRANIEDPVALFCEPDAAEPNHFIYSSALPSHRNFDSPLGYYDSGFSWGRFFPEPSSVLAID